MGSKRQIYERENAIIDEYMAKYPTLGAKDLTTVIHADDKLLHISAAALQSNISRKRIAIKSAIMPKPEPPTPTRPEDGEQIAITGTITREEYDKLALKTRKYDHFIRVLFAGAKNNIRVPEALYFDNRLICEQLRGLEPELYLKTFEIINREAGK